ncbi:MAG: signal recognition particle receptor subunit alpha [Candidatus Baldrarchaeia archaeon]
MVLEKLGYALSNAVGKLLGRPLADERAIKEFIRDIQRALLQADVKVEQVLEVSKRIEKRAFSEKLPPGFSRREHLIKIAYEELTQLMGKKSYRLRIKPNKTNVIMLVGIQGSGKTTSAAKLARYFQKKGYKVGLVCADTYRLGAYEQLLQLGKQIGVNVYGDPSAKDPVDLALKGIEKFRKEGYDVVIVDTAGRHKDEESLMREMKELASKIKPDEVILVIDATIGQQAEKQAKAFHESTPIGSIFVTKLDGSAKGGGALSAAAATGAPISFIGVGEKVDDIEEFDPPSFIGRLMGFGDIKGLIGKAREVMAPSEAKEKIHALATGKFTLKDMLDALESFKKLGPFSRILEYLGLRYKIPDELKEVAMEKIKKWKVILQSMTKEELENPKIIKGSRITRIARGSGTSVSDVKELLNQYFLFKKMYRKLLRARRLGRITPDVAS